MTRVTVKRAWTPDGPAGWDLFIDGEWSQRYPTRAMARRAQRDVRNDEAVTALLVRSGVEGEE